MSENRLYQAGLKAAEQNDFKTAAEYYQRSASEENCADAVFELGVCYLFGDGVPQDTPLAIGLLRQAGDAGNSTATAMLVKYYLLEAPEDTAGTAFVKNAVSGGCIPAIDLLKQVCKNEKFKALSLIYKEELSALAVNGDDDALFCVLQALMPDEKPVIDYLTEMTERGCRKAQYHLGMCYLEGIMVEKDEEKAMALLNARQTGKAE